MPELEPPVLHEYKTSSGNKTISGDTLYSEVRTLASSPEEAWKKLSECNPCSHVIFPPVRTGRTGRKPGGPGA